MLQWNDVKETDNIENILRGFPILGHPLLMTNNKLQIKLLQN